MSHRPLHLVNVAPPWQSGYTVRTQSLVAAQQRIGMMPAVAVHPSWYLERGYRPAGGTLALRSIDGVSYYRRTDPRPVSRWATQVSQYLVDADVRGARRWQRRLPLPQDAWQDFAEDLVEHVRPTVVHAHMPAANFVGARRIARRLDIPTVYEVRGFWDALGPDDTPAAKVHGYPREEWRRREVLAATEADAVVTLGDAMAEELVRRGIERNKIVTIGNGVNVDRFEPSPRDPELERSLDLKGRFVAGYVTTVDRREGLDTLIGAVEILRQEMPDVCALIVGSGHDLERVKALARTLDLGSHIHFTGRVPHTDVRRYYSLIDAFVVPRNDEEVCRLVTPLKPLEAMSLAIPTVVSSLPALEELVRPGERGWSFPPGDAAALAKVLKQIADSPGDSARRARAARRWTSEHRTWQRLAGRTSEMYDELGSAGT